MTTSLRKAGPADAGTILGFIRELAAYEREPDAVVATEADILRDGFGPSPRFHVMLAEEDGAAVGFALYFFTWSTWRGKSVLYLEDLFVKPAHRGHGAGLMLMRALAAEAVRLGCPRMVWQVLDWNAPSIAFYEKLGARVLREWLTVRLDGDALLAFSEAGSAPSR